MSHIDHIQHLGHLWLSMKFVFQILGHDPPVLSDGDGSLQPAVAKQQKCSYESVSLPEGNF